MGMNPTFPTIGQLTWGTDMNTALNMMRNGINANAIATALQSPTVAFPGLYTGSVTVTFASNTGSSAIGGTNTQRVEAPAAHTFVGGIPYYFDTPRFTMEARTGSRGTFGHVHEFRCLASEFFYRANSTGGTYWVFVDDRPVTAAPVAWTGTVGATQRLTVAFPGIETHRVKVLTDLLALQSVQVAGGSSLEAGLAPTVRVMVSGDSLTEGGSAPSVPQQAWPYYAGRLLGVDMVMNAVGGSGLLNGATPYSNADRALALTDTSVDMHHFQMSVNDNGLSSGSIQAAAEGYLQSIYDANPTALVLMSGPLPMAATPALAADVRANADAGRAAAMNFVSKNVIGWVDPLMTKGVVGAWFGGMVLTAGQRVSYQGGVYKATRNTSTGSFGTIDFARVSPLYGTGNTGAVANDGNRDIFCIADGHYTPAAHEYWGRYWADHYIKALTARASGQFYLYE